MKRAIAAVNRVLSTVLILPIRFYQRFISPALPRTCKYHPSCSAYAVDALKKHGPIVGFVLAVWRLLRCNPWSSGGVDYVPDKLTWGYFVPKNLRKKGKDNEEERREECRGNERK